MSYINQMHQNDTSRLVALKDLISILNCFTPDDIQKLIGCLVSYFPKED